MKLQGRRRVVERNVQIEPHHLAELWRVLDRHRSEFESVRVFGSRATGRARRASDIDIVLTGLTSRVLGRIEEDLEESSLPMTVDVLVYEEVRSDILRDHIDRLALPLPTLSELAQAA